MSESLSWLGFAAAAMGALGYCEQEHHKKIDSKKAAFLITAMQNYDRTVSAGYFL
ncbi:hypothetical protein [Niabella hibiscisoli]|uniref:hypothetical protein n=1 Tax=Niabella hibiscisoli TaxID=1825928 RepID=UPI001F10069B|nr:hypothetical protein [Niabella hibiscisoli]MCH5716170.1 hypothetical protein [Niabella hibiscisoli]